MTACHFKNVNQIIRIPSFDLLIHVTQRKSGPYDPDMHIDPTWFQPWPKSLYYHYTATITITLLTLPLVFKVDRGSAFLIGFQCHTLTKRYDMKETITCHTAQCWLAIKSNPM